MQRPGHDAWSPGPEQTSRRCPRAAPGPRSRRRPSRGGGRGAAGRTAVTPSRTRKMSSGHQPCWAAQRRVRGPGEDGSRSGGLQELGRDPWVISGAQAAAGPLPAVRSVARDPGWILPLSVFIFFHCIFRFHLLRSQRRLPSKNPKKGEYLTDKETEAQRCSDLQSGLDLDALGQHVRSGSQPGREPARHVLLCPGPDRWRGPRCCRAGAQAAVGGGKPPGGSNLPRSQGCAGRRQPNLGAAGNSSAPTADLPPSRDPGDPTRSEA